MITKFNLQIMKNRTIYISASPPSSPICAICGQSEEARNYISTWTHDNISSLSMNIYLSQTLNLLKKDILNLLDKKLDKCKNESDLLNLHGEII